MPEDDDIELFQKILRADPENEDVKNTLRHLHRLEDARSESLPSPPPPCTADISRKLLTPAVRKHPDRRPSPSLRIDDEISKLIDKGVTYLDGRQAVVDGCMWGDYYVRLKLGKVPARRAAAKVAAEDAGQALALVDTLLRFHASDLVFLIADPGLPRGDVGSPAQVSADIKALKTARNALETLTNLCGEVSRNTGGRPAHYWRLGFTYGVELFTSQFRKDERIGATRDV